MQKRLPLVLALFASALLSSIATADTNPPRTDWKFTFAPGKAEPAYTQVSPETLFTDKVGYGFEPGANVTVVDRGGDGPNRAFITSEKPFFFSVAVPEGNYKVTVTLGDPKGESTTTIKAELRRLMVEKLHTASGEIATRSFIVNVRTPKIAGDREVHLKPREKTEELVDWDNKLTLEFNDARPCLCALEIAPADVPTIYILGDSTVCDQPREPWNSWGQMLPRFFTDGVAVANHAESGESLRSSLGARRLAKVLSLMKPGDYLFIQYGHNDMKEKGPGVGAFTTYTADLKKFVDGAKSKGGTPVLVTSMNRKSLDSSGKIKNTLGDYPEAVRRVAKDENVPLIDLNAMSARLYEAWGPKNIGKAFQDGTHHNNYGSYELAKCIVEGIREDHLPIARFIAPDVGPFDPSHPDPVDGFSIPASPQFSTAKPEGN